MPRAYIMWGPLLPELRRLIEAGKSHKAIGKIFGCDAKAINQVCYRYGIASRPEAVNANRSRGLKAAHVGTDLCQRKSAIRKASLQRPDVFEAMQRGLTNSWTPAARAKAGATLSNRLLADIPEQFRDAHRHHLYAKGYSAAESRAMLRPLIAAWLQTHEGRMWKVSTGRARIVEKHHFSLPVSATGSLMSSTMAGI